MSIIQGTPEWFQARLGKVTASRVADIIAKTKSGASALRATYMAQLICERLTGTVAESYSNAAMQHGTDTEPMARLAYCFYENADVEEIGFVPHPTIDHAGCSPDGLVGDHGLIEIKCPATATHLSTLISGKVADNYLTQIQWQMACTERLWCDFVSFDPRLPENMRLFVRRVERDDKRIDELETEVSKFLFELGVKLSELNILYGEAA